MASQPGDSCWLVKSEPGCYSIDDLKRDKRTAWTGVRNYQARNLMRDHMKVGDGVLFYHSGDEGDAGPGVAGIAKVVGAAHADETALDPKDDHFDPKATRAEPIWMAVDVGFVEKFKVFVPLTALRKERALAKMAVLQRGQRLSVMPVSPAEFEIVCAMGRM